MDDLTEKLIARLRTFGDGYTHHLTPDERKLLLAELDRLYEVEGYYDDACSAAEDHRFD